MTPLPLEIVAWISLLVAFASAGLIVFDIARGHPQQMKIMNVVWPITALYFGPLGLLAYWRFGRAKAEPAATGAGDHAAHQQRPFWQTVFTSTSHCGGGCTLGDTVGEGAIYLTGFVLAGSALLTAYAVDFAIAYILGVIFQYFAIAPMRDLSPGEGIKEAIKADTLSLIAFEVGMFAWMALTRLVFFDPPLEANNVVFWFMMQIAMIVGFATSYPANWWLVRKGIKEEM